MKIIGPSVPSVERNGIRDSNVATHGVVRNDVFLRQNPDGFHPNESLSMMVRYLTDARWL